MFNAIDYEAQQRVIAYCKRRAPTYSEAGVIAALESIYDAMLGAEVMIGEMVTRHDTAFSAQLVGANITPLIVEHGPYLETETANLQYFFVKRMEVLFTRVAAFLHDDSEATKQGFYSANSDELKALDHAMEWKAFDNHSSLAEQVDIRIFKDIERAQVQTNQRLDEQQQRMVGFTHYIWRSRDDDKVRSLHASYDNAVFSWDNPPEGGHPGRAFGCRCTAEPYLASLTTNMPNVVPPLPPGDPRRIEAEAIEAVYPEFYIIPAGKVLQKMGKIIGRVGEQIIRIKEARLFRRPQGVPKDWVRTKTKDGRGFVYTKPNTKGTTYVKIQKGNPNSTQAGQRVDNVRWQRNGQSLDKNGNAISTQKSLEAHIPVKDFIFNGGSFK